jgi:hypothetical protein
MASHIETRDVRIPLCPAGCGDGHLVRVTIVREEAPQRVLTFGGAGESSMNLDVSCPVTGAIFSIQVPRGTGAIRSAVALALHLDDEAEGPVPAAPVSPAPAGEPVPVTSDTSWQDQEWLEWIKNTPGVARDFCKAMVTATAGAVPVYFALLKYLGLAQAQPGWFWTASIPPVFLLAACLVFADGLRPRAEYITETGFVAYRERRLRAMRVRINLGMTLFSGAVGMTIVLALTLMNT